MQTAGLPEGTRFHDLRHFYASTLIAAGVTPKPSSPGWDTPRSPRRWIPTGTVP